MSHVCKLCGALMKEGDWYVGVKSRCKPCHRMAIRANRATKAEYYKAYDRMRATDPIRKAKAYESFAKAQASHPERLWAARTAGNAVRDGRLKKHPCWVCGDEAEAHHPDYSQPLDVVWLCRSHHRQAHAIVTSMDGPLEDYK